MNIKTIILSFLLSVPCFVNAQGNTVVNSQTSNASAVLDLSNNTNNKAFLPPRVTLTTLTDINTPISNPEEGLIIYNIGTTQLPGFYIFIDGVWSLMATRENSIMNAVFENKTATTLTTSIIGSFVTIGNLLSLDNNSGGDIVLNTGNNSFTLQPGKYIVNGILNITTAETNTGAAISNGTIRTHAHYYTGRLWDGDTIIGQEVQLNVISNTSGDKKHSVSFNFSFELSTVKTVNFQLARRSGGSYSGNITLNNTTIFIEKSLP